MTRWMRGYRRALPIRRITPVIPFRGVTPSPNDPILIWPTSDEVHEAQTEYRTESPKSANPADGNLIRIKGAAWVPEGRNRP